MRAVSLSAVLKEDPAAEPGSTLSRENIRESAEML